jgi:hypothetical protein
MHAYTQPLQRRESESRSFGGSDQISDAAAPPLAPLAMPDQPLHRPAEPRRFAPVPGLGQRRAALAAFCVLATGLAVSAVTAAMAEDGLNPLEVAHVSLILVLFGWMAFSFAASLGGLWLSRRADTWERTVAQAPLRPLTTRTALLAPIYHEDVGPFFARLATMRAGLHALGLTPMFDIVVLSDSRRPEVVADEQRGFAAFRRGGVGPRAYYRHRPENIDRKAGNVAEWVRRHGGAYDHMVVLDADSLMDALTLWRLAAAMERDPSVGLIQTAPTIVGRRTVFGRLEQFANTLYGPLAAWGVAWWSGNDGNYWGHNAILRVKAFAQSGGTAPPERKKAVRRPHHEPRLRRGRLPAPGRLGRAAGAGADRQFRGKPADPDRPPDPRPALVPGQPAAPGRSGRARPASGQPAAPGARRAELRPGAAVDRPGGDRRPAVGARRGDGRGRRLSAGRGGRAGRQPGLRPAAQAAVLRDDAVRGPGQPVRRRLARPGQRRAGDPGLDPDRAGDHGRPHPRPAVGGPGPRRRLVGPAARRGPAERPGGPGLPLARDADRRRPGGPSSPERGPADGRGLSPWLAVAAPAWSPPRSSSGGRPASPAACGCATPACC